MTASALALSNLRELAQEMADNALGWFDVHGDHYLPPDAILALLDQLDAAQEALRLADAALLMVVQRVRWHAGEEYDKEQYDGCANCSWALNHTAAAIAAARARQEEP